MNISVFGGAFDPPHYGHHQVVSALLQNNLADEVWLLPAKNHPFGKVMSPAVHRVAMLELLIENISDLKPDLANKLKIELYEVEHDAVSYSYQTLQALASKFPEHNFSFVIGSDNLDAFHKWYGFPRLLAFPFYVYPREGYPFKPMYDNMTALENMREVTVSSTQCRENRKMGTSLHTLVTKEVEEYIQENELYL